ncbi:MAG: winged helix-turn-helix domain-containing protein [Acidobacteria bacterium]|nr:winged helix-turn-helix domain-containing protein [Acidobacteriota bacterium]
MMIVLDAAVLSALASPRRLEILRLVWQRERAAGAISGAMPDVTPGAVSLQLRCLAEAGLVDIRVEGRHRFYRARRAALAPVSPVLEQMWSDALWRLKLLAEFEQTRRGPRPRRRRRRHEHHAPHRQRPASSPRTPRRDSGGA